MPSLTIVVPCYDEAERLRPDAFLRACDASLGLHFLFVDDGSRDGTLGLLRELAARAPERLSVLALERNRGKAEAVRSGLREAFARGHDYVGWWDADLATPLDEIPRFVAALEAAPACEIVFGARVRMLGRQIERSALRHAAGRVFATAAAGALRLPVYDTQCGAKLLRSTPAVAALFDEPFASGWVFDVELLARLLQARRVAGGPPLAGAVIEVPLLAWRDVPGSKVRPLDFVRGLVELVRIRRRYRPQDGGGRR
jgi:glycosyltransferase involved in cell wall biosynthesis